MADSDGDSPAASNSWPPRVIGHQLVWVTVEAQVPGELQRLLGIDDLVVVGVEDEERRISRRDVGDGARLLQVGAQVLRGTLPRSEMKLSATSTASPWSPIVNKSLGPAMSTTASTLLDLVR